jgi:hypothetical protein
VKDLFTQLTIIAGKAMPPQSPLTAAEKNLWLDYMSCPLVPIHPEIIKTLLVAAPFSTVSATNIEDDTFKFLTFFLLHYRLFELKYDALGLLKIHVDLPNQTNISQEAIAAQNLSLLHFYEDNYLCFIEKKKFELKERMAIRFFKIMKQLPEDIRQQVIQFGVLAEEIAENRAGKKAEIRERIDRKTLVFFGYQSLLFSLYCDDHGERIKRMLFNKDYIPRIVDLERSKIEGEEVDRRKNAAAILGEMTIFSHYLQQKNLPAAVAGNMNLGKAERQHQFDAMLCFGRTVFSVFCLGVVLVASLIGVAATTGDSHTIHHLLYAFAAVGGAFVILIVSFCILDRKGLQKCFDLIGLSGRTRVTPTQFQDRFNDYLEEHEFEVPISNKYPSQADLPLWRKLRGGRNDNEQRQIIAAEEGYSMKVIKQFTQ